MTTIDRTVVPGLTARVVDHQSFTVEANVFKHSLATAVELAAVASRIFSAAPGTDRVLVTIEEPVIDLAALADAFLWQVIIRFAELNDIDVSHVAQTTVGGTDERIARTPPSPGGPHRNSLRRIRHGIQRVRRRLLERLASS